MAEAVTAGAAALLPGLPDEIVVWEVLVRLPPKSILRCRAVCRAWRRTTSTRAFLLAHHRRQPSLPILFGFDKSGGRYQSILTFDHRAGAGAQIRPVARLHNDNLFHVEASCDGLLLLSGFTPFLRPCFSVRNPATGQRAFLRQPEDASLFSVLGMYLHRPSGEYRLLLHRPRNCYVSVLGSDQPPRRIPGPEGASELSLHTPALVQDSLHWSPVLHRGESRLIVFDTAAESFRQIRPPVAPTNSCIFEMDGKLGIYSYDDATKVVHIWVLTNYEAEVWEYKHRVELPAAKIREQFGGREGQLRVIVVSTDGAVILLLGRDQWLFHVDVDGKLVDSFDVDVKRLYLCGHRLKQNLVPHTFFTALEEYAVNASFFI